MPVQWSEDALRTIKGEPRQAEPMKLKDLPPGRYELLVFLEDSAISSACDLPSWTADGKLLVECDPQFGINRLVRSIRGQSSRVLRQEFPSLKTRLPCLWTNSYFVATVGGAPLAVIKQYIENQKNV
jgi:putative transposase